MTEDDAYQAINNRLNAVWPTLFGTSAVPPILRDNESGFAEPFDTTGSPLPWLYFEVQFTPVMGTGGANDGQITVGAPGQNWDRKWGMIAGQVFVSSGQGDDQARQIAIQFGRIYQMQEFGGVTCWTASLKPGADADATNSQASSGNWWRRTSVIPLYFDDEV